MDLSKLPPSTPEEFTVVIEIPRGSQNKYEYDEPSGTFVLDFVFKDLAFIENYGFIPGTHAGDGDTLDVFVVTPQPLLQGAVIRCRTVGVLETLDRGEVDNKIIAVPVVGSEEPIPTERKFREWFDFYQEVARQKQKTIEIIGLKDEQAALEKIKAAIH
jgi:inorganic pyrophosphatase